jgi:hypothetical protein
MDQELIGGDPPHRLCWGDVPGWTVQREVAPGQWSDVAAYDAEPPLAPRQFAKWLASQTGLTFDLAWDAVEWLREHSPSRFSDPYVEEE